MVSQLEPVGADPYNVANYGTRISDGMPGNVLIVEDDPIIALDFEDTILGFGVKAVRTAGNVAKPSK